LDELLATEGEIAADDAAAAEKVRSLLDNARAAVGAAERVAAAALQRELGGLDVRAQDAQKQAVAEIEADAARIAARYHTLAAEDIARLADFVCDRVTTVDAAGPT
jgi:phage gpG-like protein